MKISRKWKIWKLIGELYITAMIFYGVLRPKQKEDELIFAQ